MNKKTVSAAILILALAGGGAYYYYAPQKAAAQLAYQTAGLSHGNIESTVNASGTVQPVVTVLVGSELSGTISELKADFNSEVKKGGVLARLDDRTIISRMNQNQADIDSARASLALAQAQYQRTEPLVQRGLISRADLDTAKSAYRVAQAQLAQKQATLAQTKLDLDHTTIRAPMDGIVIDRQVDVGQTVAASLSAPTLFKIAQDLSKMQIEASVDEADIGKIKEGQTARFTVDSYPSRKFTGTVSQVRKASTVTANVVTYTIIVKADNPDNALLPGMTANLDMVIGQKENVLRAPNAALRFKPTDTGAASGGQQGGGGSGGGAQMRDMLTKLNLNADQQKQADAALAEFRADLDKARSASSSGGGGGFGPDTRAQMMQLRQKMDNQMKTILTDAQYADYQKLSAEMSASRKASGAGAAAGADGMQRGQVWVLQDGKPTQVRVMTGLANNDFTEVQSDKLDDKSQVIVRASKSVAP